MTDGSLQTGSTATFGRPLLAILIAVWLLLVAAGMAVLACYSNKPGLTGTPPAIWPPGSRLELARDQPTLLLFAHPRCPCTRATMGELMRTVADCRGRLQVQVLFVRPGSLPGGLVHSDLYRRAETAPGVAVSIDDGGREAELFGARTSGHVLLYNARGELMFSGGLTASRGHEGGNVGRTAVVAAVRGLATARQRSTVFGCPLQSPESLATHSNRSIAHCLGINDE